MSEEFNTQELMQEFFDDWQKPVTGLGYGDFMKVRLYPAVWAKAGENTKFFPMLELGKEGAMQAALEHLEQNDVEPIERFNPTPCIVFRRYRDSILNRAPYNWREEIWEDGFDRTNIPWVKEDGKTYWGLHKYSLVEQSWAITEYDVGEHPNNNDPDMVNQFWNVISQDMEGAPLQQRWGQDLWAHVGYVIDPTFDPDRPETFRPPYNCDQTETYAKRYPILRAAFETEEELLAYMAENGFELAGEGDSEQGAIESIEITPALQEWLDEYGVPWYNKETQSGVAVEIITELGKNGGNLMAVHKSYGNFPLDIIKQLANIPPF